MEQVDKKVLKQQLEDSAADLFEKQSQLALLEKQLEQNVEFKNYLVLQRNLKDQDKLFRESVKEEMIKYEIPKLKGEWGSITLVEKDLYKVVDANKVPNEYKQEKTIIDVDTKAIKEDYTLTGILPAGVEVNKSKYILIKEKKNG